MKRTHPDGAVGKTAKSRTRRHSARLGKSGAQSIDAWGKTASASRTSKLLMAAGRGLGKDLHGEATVQERDLVPPHPQLIRPLSVILDWPIYPMSDPDSERFPIHPLACFCTVIMKHAGWVIILFLVTTQACRKQLQPKRTRINPRETEKASLPASSPSQERAHPST